MPVVGAMAENATLFLVYGQAQQLIRRLPFPGQAAEGRPCPLPLPYVALAAACGGATASVILTPIELVKCKMQVQQIGAAKENKWLAGPAGIVRAVLKQHGIRGLWLGQTGTLVRETGGSALWFCTFEAGAALLVARRQAAAPAPTPALSKDDLSAPELMLAGAAAGVLYNLAFFPADSVKSAIETASELAAHPPSHPPQIGILPLARQIVRTRRWKGLYAGCGITCLRSAPSSALIFWIVSSLERRFG